MRGWRWFAPGEACLFGDWLLPGGMFYVGRGLASVAGYGEIEPALIDPHSATGPGRDPAGNNLSYWPSYSGIPPTSRASYLDWIARGRQDPHTPIGYVFLFFYGLERRVLSDLAGNSGAAEELTAIAVEVARLLRIYRDNDSFRGYASTFLDLIRVMGRDRTLEEAPAVGRPVSAVRLAYVLAKLVAEGRPVPWEWALTWAMSSADCGVAWRTPATRCAREFREVFRLRYEANHGGGLCLSPNRTRLHLSYQPSTASLRGGIKLQLEGLPDVTQQRSVVQQLMALAVECEQAIEPYSRFLGRNPDSARSVAAAAMLPGELLRHSEVHTLAKLRDQLAEAVGATGQTRMEGRQLLRWWPTADGRFSKRDHVQVAQLFGKLGYGMEPDPRFGGPTLTEEQSAILFRLPDDSPEAGSAEYKGALLMARLFLAVAQADGHIDDAERTMLAEQLRANASLSRGERARLSAHLRWLVRSGQVEKGLQGQVGKLTEATKTELGRFLVCLAGADGVVAASEVETLRRVFRWLGLDPEGVHQALHLLAAGAQPSGPVTVETADADRDEFAIPSQGGQTNTGFRLNQELVDRAIEDANRLALMLGGVFDEDVPAPRPDTQDDLPAVAGLDGPHTALLQRLSNVEVLDRTELEQWADDLGLMPDGALDRLNGAAVERFEEPLVDGDDPLIVNVALAQEMLL